MMQLSTFMWFMGIFLAVIGFLRGWRPELIISSGIVLTMFALFQFDGFLRSTIFLTLPRGQVFFVQAAIFITVVLFLYQADELGGAEDRDEDDYQSGALGAIVGFINGYLIGGTLWYFLDINEYPWDQFVIAPGPNSPSSEALNLIPLVILGGGASGTGDLLAIVVLALLFIVFITL
jgi:hypothetical protein